MCMSGGLGELLVHFQDEPYALIMSESTISLSNMYSELLI